MDFLFFFARDEQNSGDNGCYGYVVCCDSGYDLPFIISKHFIPFRTVVNSEPAMECWVLGRSPPWMSLRSTTGHLATQRKPTWNLGELAAPPFHPIMKKLNDKTK